METYLRTIACAHVARFSSCSNRSTRTPVDTWNAAKRRLVGFLESPRTPPGIIVVTLKFVQRVILVQSRAFSDPRVAQSHILRRGICIDLYLRAFQWNDYSCKTSPIRIWACVRPITLSCARKT